MVWRSMVTAARRSGVNALVFAGGAIDEAPYNPYEKNLNIAYDLVRPEYLDGVIVNNIIGAYVGAVSPQPSWRGNTRRLDPCLEETNRCGATKKPISSCRNTYPRFRTKVVN